MLTVKEARDRVLARMGRVGVERVMLGEVHGRILAESIVSQGDWPRFTNAAMDGIAARFDDLVDSINMSQGLRVVGTAVAGQFGQFVGELGVGEACRVMTGAVLPAGADTVVMREHVRELGGSAGEVRVVVEVRPRRRGEHVRVKGEEMRAGVELYQEGDRVDVGMVGVLASMGRSQVRVFRRPRVAIVTTGDELVEVDERVGEGQIVNSTSYVLAEMVREAGGEPWVLPRVRDDEAQIEEALRAAAKGADFIVSVGGVSVGDRDLVRGVMGRLMGGEEGFWRVAMRPGKPLAFGDIGNVPLLGLPGNPVSSYVTFVLFGVPALRKMGGVVVGEEGERLRVRSLGVAQATADREEYVRGRLRVREGALWFEVFGGQGSGNVYAVVGCRALGVLPPGGRVGVGDWLDVLVLGDLGEF